jgi:hypothetical protein
MQALMAGITLAQAEAQLALYLAAEAAVLAKQSYTISGRQLTLANLAEIQRGIEIWNARATSLGATSEGRGRLRTIVPGG